MLRTKTLSYQDDDLEVTLELGAATALSGVKRSLLLGRAIAYLEQQDAQDTSLEAAARRITVHYLYPDLLACVLEAEGLDAEMAVEDFLALPQALTDAWQNAVYELNPHWYPFQGPESEESGEDSAEASPQTETVEKKGDKPPGSDSDSSS